MVWKGGAGGGLAASNSKGQEGKRGSAQVLSALELLTTKALHDTALVARRPKKIVGLGKVEDERRQAMTTRGAK